MARYRFPGNRLIFLAKFSTILLPQITIISLYSKGFLRGLPQDLYDAARILVQATRSGGAVTFSSTASKFSRARCPMASRVSMVALPRCGSSETFSSVR